MLYDMKKQGGGRPKLPDGERRDVVLQVRVKAAAADGFKEKAREKGLSPSAAMREALFQWTRTG